MLEPPLKRSVKGEPKGIPLPLPLMSTPLPMKSLPALTMTLMTTSTNTTISSPSIKDGVMTTMPATTGVFAYSSHPHHAQMKMTPQSSGHPAQPVNVPNSYAVWTLHPMSTLNKAPTTANPPSSLNSTPSVNPSQPQLPQPPTPPVSDISLPIILGPIPPTHPDYSPSHPHNSAKRLHDLAQTDAHSQS